MMHTLWRWAPVVGLCMGLLACGGGPVVKAPGAEAVVGEKTLDSANGSTRRSKSRAEGSLTTQEIIAALKPQISKIQRCYEKSLKGDRKAGGKLVAQWTVSPTGQVEKTKFLVDTLKKVKLSQCVMGIIKKLVFPKPQGGTAVVKFPFVFSPGE